MEIFPYAFVITKHHATSSDKENKDSSHNGGYKAGERPPYWGTTLLCSATSGILLSSRC